MEDFDTVSEPRSTSSGTSDLELKQTPTSRNAASSSPRSAHSPSSISSDSTSNEAKSQEKICVVCGDIATGTHFAAMTCEGCKGFFRRSMKKCSQFTCAFENQCAINKSNRKHCQSCRLKKCLSVGMNSNLIMSDESVTRKRELIRVNREKKAMLRIKKEQEETEQRNKNSDDSPKPVIQMMAEDKALIKMMLDSHNTSYDFSYEDYETFRGRQHIAAPDSEEIKRTQVTLAWLMAGNADEDSSPEHSPPGATGNGKKKSVEEGDDVTDRAKKVKAERHHSQQENFMRKQDAASSGEVLDMFSTLHGVSQPNARFPRPQQSVPSTSSGRHDSCYSDGSGSSSSASPYQPPQSQNYGPDPFSAGFSPFDVGQPSASQNTMMTMFGDASSMMGPGDFDSMSYLQGLFTSQGLGDGKPHSLFQHFCDIMTWGIKKVIEFCKCIPEFQVLSTVDQINLLRGGCLEMLVLRSYFAFASDGNKYMSEKFQYSPTDFLQAGASSEFVEQYTKVHMRMRKMKLKVEEICLLIGLVLFSPDRPGVQDCDKVESMQKRIAQALRAYEYTHHDPEKACIVYSELLLLLPVLRTINVLFSNTILTLKSSNEDDMDPLILEVNN